MTSLSLVLVASLIALTTSAATKTLVERADVCGQWDSRNTGTYTLYNDEWGISGSTGSQCVGVDSLSGTTIKWHATWSWTAGSGGVKTYPNVVANYAAKQLSAISSMKTSWSWSYSGSSIVADVAYDLFTSSSATGSNENEIMIWLAAYGGAGPISASYDSSGSPVPVATVTLAGYSWKLYKGSNGVNEVYSFLPATGSIITIFSGDIKTFISYLTSNQGLSSSQYLISAGAGSEPTSGSGAKFTVSGYSLVIA
ncbi:Endoglucanase cel12C [Lecanosticta acicola]|uniref:Endoglucanase cel12C n=1 Tax=Lecanosticta acicola TaxID=111012 RepID=A0AAI9EFA9_9PEZI|nr:Endoglucanase cel12C [Lecanosticta acicola]